MSEKEDMLKNIISHTKTNKEELICVNKKLIEVIVDLKKSIDYLSEQIKQNNTSNG